MGDKKYSAEFRRRAVELMGAGSTHVAQLAEELGVSQETLYTWRRQHRRRRLASADERAELAAAKKRIEELEAELKIQRRAAELRRRDTAELEALPAE